MVFKKIEDSPTFSKSANRKEPPSIISADLHIVGDIDSKGELHVEGRVDGNIRCERLTIGDTGQVEGKIVTTALSLLGSVTGTVRARTVKIIPILDHWRERSERAGPTHPIPAFSICTFTPWRCRPFRSAR